MNALSPQKLSLQNELIATFLISATLNSDHVGSIPVAFCEREGNKGRGEREIGVETRERESGRERKGASGVKEL